MEAKSKTIKCILIDDEKESCDRLQELMGKMPEVSVVAYETIADKGIASVVKYSPDIVFLDVEMPGKNGFEVVKEIRNKNTFPTFIFVTGYSQYAIKAIRNAAFDFLVKPVDIDELRETIDRFHRSDGDKFEKELPAKLKAKYHLTDREIEIVKLLIQGKTSQVIANLLFISKNTVDTHRRKILSKTNTNSTSELISHIHFL